METFVNAPIERVWERFSDHEGYTAFKGVGEATLLAPGKRERNGVGAVRRIRFLGVLFVEDITAFEPPGVLEYRVRECSLPVRHRQGRVELSPREGGTEIRWWSRFEVPLPVMGGILGKGARLVFQRAFQRAVQGMKRDLEGSA